ncbi:hypothetical protein BGZ58_001919 [Dissophora ornata]|nr:hypothetical protein BGZ58_001919 [Dissophora ornata]
MHPNTADLYRTLGVSKTSTHEEIRRAYRRLVLLYHPDRANAAEVPDFETKFREINAAYDVLRDPQTRSVYDNYGKIGVKIVKTNLGSKLALFANMCRAVFGMIAPLALLLILFLCFLSVRVDELVNWSFYIVFIPLWIVDVYGITSNLFIAVVLRSGILKSITNDDDINDDDGSEQTATAERQRRRRQEQNMGQDIVFRSSIVDLVKLLLFTVFQVLIVEKANDPSSIPTPAVFAPYFAMESMYLLSAIGEMFDSTGGVSHLKRLFSAVDNLSWIVTRAVLAVLIMLRIENYIDCSWNIVCIPLYVAGVLFIIGSFTIFKMMEKAHLGLSLCLTVLFSVLMILLLWFPLVRMLAAKLDGEPYATYHVLIPLFVFLSTLFCCTGCCLPQWVIPDTQADIESGTVNEAIHDMLRETGRGAGRGAGGEADRNATTRLISPDRRIQNGSYASTGTSKQLIVR